ncbi:Beta-1,3-N-acetylglucosaminyltransferase lunatic fringe [Quillaja saponaria]|uniref:Beta-1,3-N-acetylglucosaminyltransferase lunatic fringe n=1 Tax=Quillaja saponaria TaxID=32244 RepID=A0AAD7LQE5_QUISA|nr:Beta-1,3-N-acetylglucosaminyltransferase lunatic fringe [Quillaja saponaria]
MNHRLFTSGFGFASLKKIPKSLRISTMKSNFKDPEHPWTFSKLMVMFFLLISISYLLYSLKFITSSYTCNPNPHTTQHHQSDSVAIFPSGLTPNLREKTNLSHIVFGIAASAKLWNQRKDYIKLWWRPAQMRGIVWLDEPVEIDPEDEEVLPQFKISSDTSKFKYKNAKGNRSAIRISRIVSETLRLGMEGVRWFVMGDDDTVFVAENLVKVLQKYDHNQFYYIGSSSESHLQNIYFSYNMAYGGGGFAISYPLAKALEKMQDRCIQRYSSLYGSDDRIQACMAELGVPLTKERGFHQYDVHGDLFGLLAAHPVAPLVSLHHLDIVDPIFPKVSQVEALQRLKVPMKLDPAALMQQSICYDKNRSWTISVSWGYAVQIFRSTFSAREMEMPSRTFLNWYKRADYTSYAFNTRPVSRHICQTPFVYYLSYALYNPFKNETASEYVRTTPNLDCKWKMADPSKVERVEVYKKPDPHLWDKSPRRNCCRIVPTKKKGTLVVNVGLCEENEIVE